MRSNSNRSGTFGDGEDNLFVCLVFVLRQGLPGFFGSIGLTGIAGEKVCLVSVCHTLLKLKFVVHFLQHCLWLFVNVMCDCGHTQNIDPLN